MMTYGSLISRLREIYASSDIAEFSDFIHFCDAIFESLGISREQRLLYPERELDESVALENAFKVSLGTPLEYILGKAGFYKEEYLVGEGVLIPRSDSECIVASAIELVPKGALVADICSGSGCLGISLLCARADLRLIACDISPTALSYTRLNGERMGVLDRMTVLEHDLLSERLENIDFLISNPPYIKSALIDTLPLNVRREPRLALDGGEDGMIFYKAIKEKYCDFIPTIIELGESWQNIFFNAKPIYDQRKNLRAVYTSPNKK